MGRLIIALADFVELGTEFLQEVVDEWREDRDQKK
jgi:hypothetical protein